MDPKNENILLTRHSNICEAMPNRRCNSRSEQGAPLPRGKEGRGRSIWLSRSADVNRWNAGLYPNNLKNREFDKKSALNLGQVLPVSLRTLGKEHGSALLQIEERINTGNNEKFESALSVSEKVLTIQP